MKYHPTELQRRAIIATQAPSYDKTLWLKLINAIRRETGLTTTQIRNRIHLLANGNYQEANQ